MSTEIDPIRNPIGPFKVQEPISDADLKGFVAEIAAFPARLRELVRNMDNAALDRSYRPGGWTVRQIVHHCADSHMNAYVRLKLALTEDNPTIKPYDQDAWALLPDSKLPIAVSLDLIEALHCRWTELLKKLEPEQLDRTFYHPEYAKSTVLRRFVASYAWHSNHHLGHIQIVAKG